MKHQIPDEAVIEFNRAQRAILLDNTVAGLAGIEKALALFDTKEWYSFLGYCIAKERGQVSRGTELCLVSLEYEPNNPEHYLNLGKIQLISGNKAEAIQTFRKGMSRGGNAELIKQLNEFGRRKMPPIPFLHRSNPVNKYLGLFFSKLGLR